MDVYLDIALLAGFAVLFIAVTGPARRSVFSDAIIFVAFGLVAGPSVLGLLDIDIETETGRLLAELTLAVVLFSDAAGADFKILRQFIKAPVRLLGLGLPLTVIAGALVAKLVFPELSAVEAAILGTILAPTDAALGKAVVSNPSVPADVRQVLNVESGLNDGICVPLLLAFLVVAGSTTGEHSLPGLLGHFALEEIGIGLLVGAAAAVLGYVVLKRSVDAGWVKREQLSIPVVAIALLAFAAAQALGGSGFIAAFAGGMLFGALTVPYREHLLGATESMGGVLSYVTWVIFGAAIVGPVIEQFDYRTLIYAVLSLTVIRMLPVFLSLTGLKYRTDAKLFMGWFGPRGLATVVFVVIVFGESLPHGSTIVTVAMTTVLLSIVAHGVTANPLATAFGRRAKSEGQAPTE